MAWFSNRGFAASLGVVILGSCASMLWADNPNPGPQRRNSPAGQAANPGVRAIPGGQVEGGGFYIEATVEKIEGDQVTVHTTKGMVGALSVATLTHTPDVAVWDKGVKASIDHVTVGSSVVLTGIMKDGSLGLAAIVTGVQRGRR